MPEIRYAWYGACNNGLASGEELWLYDSAGNPLWAGTASGRITNAQVLNGNWDRDFEWAAAQNINNLDGQPQTISAHISVHNELVFYVGGKTYHYPLSSYGNVQDFSGDSNYHYYVPQGFTGAVHPNFNDTYGHYPVFDLDIWFTDNYDGHLDSDYNAILVPEIGTEIDTTTDPSDTIGDGRSAYTYQWYRHGLYADPAVQIINGATQSTYTPVADDLGFHLECRVSTAVGNFSFSASTGQTTRPVGGVEYDPEQEPTKTSLTSLSISPQIMMLPGPNLITATVSPSGATATYQWYYSSDGTTWTADSDGNTEIISARAANGPEYPVKNQASHVGKYLKCVATGTGDYEGTVSAQMAQQITYQLPAPSIFLMQKGRDYLVVRFSSVDYATEYELEFGRNPLNVTPISNPQPNTNITIPNLSEDTSYVIQARAKGTTGFLTSSNGSLITKTWSNDIDIALSEGSLDYTSVPKGELFGVNEIVVTNNSDADPDDSDANLVEDIPINFYVSSSQNGIFNTTPIGSVTLDELYAQDYDYVECHELPTASLEPGTYYVGWKAAAEDDVNSTNDGVVCEDRLVITDPISITNYSGQYDGAAHGVTVSGTVAGDIVQYGTVADSLNAADWSTTAPTRSAVGTNNFFVRIVRGSQPFSSRAASITVSKKQLTVTGTTVASKEPDGTTTATITLGTVSGVVGNENVTVSASGEFPSAVEGSYNVTVNYAISGTDSGNYLAPTADSIAASIQSAALTGITATSYSDQYDGAAHGVTLTGLESGDDVYYRSSPSNEWSSTEITRTVPGTSNVYVKVERGGRSWESGALTIDISKREITVAIFVADREYNGTTKATVSYALSGVVSGESVILNGGTANFEDKNASNQNQTVTYKDYAIYGSQANMKYVLKNSTATTQAKITPKRLTISGTTLNKTYDGTTDATITLGTLEGVVEGESVEITASGEFPSANVGEYDVEVTYSIVESED